MRHLQIPQIIVAAVSYPLILCDMSVSRAQAETAPSIQVSDHRPAPLDLIRIDRVSVTEPGWIVIYGDDHGKRGDKQLGKIPVSPGENTNLTVRIDRDIIDEEELWAVIYPRQSQDNIISPDDHPISGPAGELSTAFRVERPLTAPGPYLPFKPSLPLTLSSGVLSSGSSSPDQTSLSSQVKLYGDHGDTFTFICVPLNCKMKRIAFDVAMQNKSGEVEVRLVAPDRERPGVGRPMTLMTARGRQTINETFPYTKIASSDMSSSIAGRPSIGWWIAEFIAKTPDAIAQIDYMRLYIDCEGKTPEWPAIIPHVHTANQMAKDGNHVTVHEVISYGPGWISIYADDHSGPKPSMYYRHVAAPGAPGEFLGATHVSYGENINVVVGLNRQVKAGEALYAVLHEDTKKLGDFAYKGRIADFNFNEKDLVQNPPVEDLVTPGEAVQSWFYIEGPHSASLVQ